jgi:hypothetical protein
MVCFTGPAIDRAGDPILRDVLTRTVARMGMTVHTTMTSATQLLVASRTDTVKAQKAASRGIPVLTYPTFLEQFQVAPGPGKAGIRDSRVDTHHIHTPKKIDPSTWVDVL